MIVLFRILPHFQSFQELYLSDGKETDLRSRATTALPENWLDKLYSRTIVSSRRRKDRQETAGMEGVHNANGLEHETVVIKVEDNNSISEPKQDDVDTKDNKSIQINPGLLAELPQTDLNTRDFFRPVAFLANPLVIGKKAFLYISHLTQVHSPW